MIGMAIHKGLDTYNLQLLSKMFVLAEPQSEPQTAVIVQVSPYSVSIKTVF